MKGNGIKEQRVIERERQERSTRRKEEEQGETKINN